MKTLLFGLLLFTFLQSDSQVLWKNHFNFNTVDEFQDVLPLENCGYLFVGNSAFVNVNTGICKNSVRLTQLDEEGNLVWSQSYQIGGRNLGRLRIYPLNNGNEYLILGQSELLTNKADDIFWIKAKANGTKILYKSNPVDTALQVADRIVGSSQLHSGDIIWIQEKYNFEAPTYNEMSLYLNKINSNGELVFSKLIDHELSNTVYFKDLAINANEEIMLLGFNRFNRGDFAMYLLKLNSQGELIWKKKFDDYYLAYDLEYKDNGHFLILANSFAATNGLNALEVDENGDILCSTNLKHYLPLNGWFCQPCTDFNIVPMKNNFFIATENFDSYESCPPANPVDYMYYSLNYSCDSMLLDTIYHDGEDHIVNAKRMDDERIMLLGSGIGAYAVLIGKSLRTCLTSSNDLEESNVKIFPNPIKGNEFNIQNLKDKLEKLSIYDNMGKSIRTWNGDQLTFSIDGFPNGIYIWKLLYRNGSSISGKLAISN